MRILLAALVVFAALPLTAGALPGACADPCTIEASSAPGYQPVVAAIASGASVVWRSTDVTHVTRDLRVGAGGACFEVRHAAGEDSILVRFDIEGASLVATVLDESIACRGAIVSAAGATVTYFCTLHPTMRGTLVITT